MRSTRYVIIQKIPEVEDNSKVKVLEFKEEDGKWSSLQNECSVTTEGENGVNVKLTPITSEEPREVEENEVSAMLTYAAMHPDIFTVINNEDIDDFSKK